ncbi:unnamed protein product, partial [marine sediment metagenome]
MSQFTKRGQSFSGSCFSDGEPGYNIAKTPAFLKPFVFEQPVEKSGGEGITGTGGVDLRYCLAAGFNDVFILSVSNVAGSHNGFVPSSFAQGNDNDMTALPETAFGSSCD